MNMVEQWQTTRRPTCAGAHPVNRQLKNQYNTNVPKLMERVRQIGQYKIISYNNS